MNINTKNLVSITEANQNFSRVARLVDENGAAVILKNNVPRYLLIEFSQAEQETLADDEDVMAISKRLIAKKQPSLSGACQMKRLTKEQVLLLHSQLIQEFGGAMTCGRKDFLNPPWLLHFKASAGKICIRPFRPKRRSWVTKKKTSFLIEEKSGPVVFFFFKKE